MPAPSSRASRDLSCFCRARLPRRAALGFLLDCTANPEYLRVPHPRPMRVGAYDRTPRSLFSVGCPRFDFLPGSWVPLPRESLRTARDCHPERSGPTFSSAPISGASGRALEDLSCGFLFSVNSVLLPLLAARPTRRACVRLLGSPCGTDTPVCALGFLFSANLCVSALSFLFLNSVPAVFLPL